MADNEDPCDPKDLIRAKHHDGAFYWGPKPETKPGRWVKICKWCCEWLIDNWDGAEECDKRKEPKDDA